MRFSAILAFAPLGFKHLSPYVCVSADGAADDAVDDGGGGDDYYVANDVADDGGGDDGGGNDDDYYNNAAKQNYYVDDDDENKPDDYIKYWSEYAIQAKRCIVYNNVDMIMFTMYEQGYRQCSNAPMGYYVTPVATFVNAYLDQVASDFSDQGIDDYENPDIAQYTECQGIVIQNQQYYTQLGCADGTYQELAVNIFSDNTCETRDVQNGFDDSNIDISDLKFPFKECKLCVVWVDKSDDEIDDMFYINRRKQAPLCSQVWSYKEECDKKCQRIGYEKLTKEGWNTSDKVLLGVLSLFGCGMLFAILRKRQNMSNKDALLEQAAMSAAGLQQAHVIGIFALALVIIIIFGSLRMKEVTWSMMLMLNLVLFSYLMKLTVDYGNIDGVVGPDGTIERIDSDDSSASGGSTGGGIIIPPLS